MSSFGALFGTFIFGILTASTGSKRAMTLLAFPVIAYWLLVHFGDSFYYLIAARFVTGWTVGGIQSAVALYVAEISTDSIRGRLSSIMPLARNLGVLIGYIVGAVVEYEHRSYIFVFFPIMYIFWLYALPNTPQYYAQRENYSVNRTRDIVCYLDFDSSVTLYYLIVKLIVLSTLFRKQRVLSCIIKAVVGEMNANDHF